MAAPKGNSFWKLRSKHGRDKIFSSPEVLWEAACEYFEWCEQNPLMEVEQAKGTSKPIKDKKTGKMVFPPNLAELPKMRAFTWAGLELFLDIDRLRDYKTKESHIDFLPVITRIEKIIYTQKFTGAAAGFLNPNIIARDLGLAEKKDQKITHKFGLDSEEEYDD